MCVCVCLTKCLVSGSGKASAIPDLSLSELICTADVSLHYLMHFLYIHLYEFRFLPNFSVKVILS